MEAKQLCNETGSLMKVMPDNSLKVENVTDAFKKST